MNIELTIKFSVFTTCIFLIDLPRYVSGLPTKLENSFFVDHSPYLKEKISLSIICMTLSSAELDQLLTIELRHEKTGFLHVRKQRCRSAAH